MSAATTASLSAKPVPSTSVAIPGVDDFRLNIIGLYGISCSGKSYLLQKVKQILGESALFFEGAEEISTLMGRGVDPLERFNSLQETHKNEIRSRAITKIRDICRAEQKHGVVAGHFCLWSQSQEKVINICTEADLQVFTRMIYLDTDIEVVAGRRHNDVRQRGALSIEHMRQWQDEEKAELKTACQANRILLTEVTDIRDAQNVLIDWLLPTSNLTGDDNSEDKNKKAVENRLQMITDRENQVAPIRRMLVFDADRTLSPADTGKLLWPRDPASTTSALSTLDEIFSGPLGYSQAAFRQAALLYQQTFTSAELMAKCEQVAQQVALYPDIAELLRQAQARRSDGVNVLVVTCGLQLVWQKILSRHGFPNIDIIGANGPDQLIIDPNIKATIVNKLQSEHGIYVTAFGDSPLDLEMLSRADRAIVVVGDQATRSKRMETEVFLWMRDGKLRAEQAILAAGAAPRLPHLVDGLPEVSLADPEFLKQVFEAERRVVPTLSEPMLVSLADDGAARLLATPLRDAENRGPSLRHAHQRAGWFLATQLLPGVLGLEEYDIRHVNGGLVKGYCVKNESKTLIVALMRGGEPMALGVSEALPRASFLHVKKGEDVGKVHIMGMAAVVLVDSVINNGKTMEEFVARIHELDPAMPIVMLAGVVQSGAVQKLERVKKRLGCRSLSLVVLRSSQNKYTGRGVSDTGHRLFNTTHLD